jgi:hypothetical protein
VRWILIAGSPELAEQADAAGVDQIMVDLEMLGKAERQGNRDTHKSTQTVKDIETIGRTVRRSELIVRINPLGSHSREEIEAALERGARRLMLPMFTTAADVDEFTSLVDGRVAKTLLVETPQALARLPQYINKLGAGDLVHFGLNDLMLALGLGFPFEVLAGRLLDGPISICQAQGVAYGVGGIGRVGEGRLPAEVVMGELVRLKASWVILSRAFHSGLAPLEMKRELQRLTEIEQSFLTMPRDELERNHSLLARIAREVEGNALAGENNVKDRSNRRRAGLA